MNPEECKKKYFFTLKQAQRFAIWSMEHKGWRSKKIRSYKCDVCIGFHVSSTEPVKITKDDKEKKKRRQRDRLQNRKSMR